MVAQTPVEKANLERFDKLDFQAWNNRNWTLFRELHAPDVIVVDFNGHTTKGIEQHVQWAMAAISAQPESRVLAHPIKIAAGNWTAGTGTLPGNLTMVTVALKSTCSCRILAQRLEVSKLGVRYCSGIDNNVCCFFGNNPNCNSEGNTLPSWI